MKFYQHDCPGRRYVPSVLSFFRSGLLLITFFLIQQIAFPSYLNAQQRPALFFDKQGMAALRDRVLSDSRLSKIWSRYKKIRVDKEAMETDVPDGPMTGDLSEGRAYGDALADLTLAYIVTRDSKYVRKAKEIALAVAAKPDWGDQLIIAHIDIGMAFFWDVLQDELTSGERNQIIAAVKSNANNHINPNPLSNHNWTPSAGEGLIGLSFGGSGASNLLRDAKENFKEGAGSVLWAHGNDGFSPQGPGYWRKYNHLGLFLYALRLNEPENDWFHLGKEYPGSEFLKNSAYPRIYGDIQHPDLSCVSWNDAQVIGYEKQGPYGNLGALIMAASEYKDGYVMDFVDYLLNEAGFRVESEDLAAFLLYNNDGVPQKSYRDLPLSRYFHDMEAAFFRSSWDNDALLFFMRCGSPGGHVRTLKDLPPDKHSHTDANGFVLFYDNDYLAAEDGHKPHSGMPDAGNTITYGHNTILVDGKGQKGDGGKTANGTTTNMDYLDAEHIGFLMGDATDAYRDLDRFYRYAVYRKHKYVVIVDELKDDTSHKYEFLLGTDHRHSIRASSGNSFTVHPEDGTARLPVIFVEPRQINYGINRERPYVFGKTQVDLLKVSPGKKSADATFFALLYPGKQRDPEPSYKPIYQGDVSGIQIDGDEYHLYNKQGSEYTFGNISTDAKLCYYKNDPQRFEYLAAGARQFSYNKLGFRSTKPLVAAFKAQRGQIRLGKNLGESGQATITLFYPGVSGVLIDGKLIHGTLGNDGEFVFELAPKERKIGPTGYEQVVTENYELEILLGTSPPSLTLTSPNGDERWQAASTQEIRWRSTGAISEVKLDYSPDNGQAWEAICEKTANDGTHAWEIPVSPSEAGLVRVVDANDPNVSDVSDGIFFIIEPRNHAEPTITSFSPSQGAVGTIVTILGTGFSDLSQVQFNGHSASSVVVKGDSEILATVPAGATTGRISVIRPAGRAVSDEVFSVEKGPVANIETDFALDAQSRTGTVFPTIDSFEPPGGMAGSDVLVAGTGFTGATKVSFAGLSSEFTVVSDFELETRVPAAASSGYLEIITPDGIAASSKQFVVETGGLLAKTAATSEVTALKSENWNATAPEDFILQTGYPNPFNAETRIRYGLPEPANVTLRIFNTRGQLVRRMVDGFESAGFKEVSWNGRDDFHQPVSSGIYWVILQAGDRKFTKTMILQR